MIGPPAMRNLFTFVVLAALCSASVLHAATVVQTVTGPAAQLSPSGSFSVNKFDPALGTLTSVDLQVTVTTGDMTFTISGTSSASYVSSTQWTDYSFTGPSGLALSGTMLSGTFTFFNIGNGQFSTTLPSKNQDASASDSSGFSEWLGSSGTVAFSYLLNNRSSASSGAGGSFQQTSPATDIGHPFGAASTFTATVTYTYTPEPGRAGLLMLGALSCFWRRRRCDRDKDKAFAARR